MVNVWELNDIKEDIKLNKDGLSSFYLDYLNCLIDLEFSVLREYVNERERGILQRSNIYWKVSLYNLLYRTLYLIEKNAKVHVYHVKKGCAVFSSSTEKMHKVFELYHVYDEKFKLDYCHLSLFQLIPDRVKRLKFVKKMMDENLNCPCPYPKEMKYAQSIWEPIHDMLVEELIVKYAELAEMNYSNDELLLMDISEKICNVLLEDFALSLDEFKTGLHDELDDDYSIDDVLIKRFPNAHLTWNGKTI